MLKSRFLRDLRLLANATLLNDRLIIVISCHGEICPGKEGQVAIGTSIRGNPNLLAPSEVFGILEEVRGSTAIIVNTCYSGMWVKAARQRGLGSGRYPNISIIVSAHEGSPRGRITQTRRMAETGGKSLLAFSLFSLWRANVGSSATMLQELRALLVH